MTVGSGAMPKTSDEAQPTSLQRRKQRLSRRECESKDEIPYPTGKPAPVEGETIEQRHDDESNTPSTAKAGAI